MRRAPWWFGVRRFSNWTEVPQLHDTGAVGLRRRCGTLAGGAVSSASTRPVSTPPPPPSFLRAASPTVSSLNSGTAVVFDQYFNDVSTTLDIAPIKRPHLVGRLVCNLEGYPITVVLVEECCGTSAEAVTESVRRSAILSAQEMQEVGQMSTKMFLVHHLCTARPGVVELLNALDLSLRVRLLRQEDPTAVPASEEGGASRNERGSVADSSASQLNKLTVQRWRCSAALYDTWHTQSRFTPVGREPGRDEKAECEEAGELLDVMKKALTRVEEKLRQLHERYAIDAVEEACRFVREVGGDFCETRLTQRCLKACIKGSDKASQDVTWRCPWWGEVVNRRCWSLQCDVDVDTEQLRAVAFHLRLSYTLHTSRSDEGNNHRAVAAVLQSSEAHRGLVQLLDKAMDGAPRCYSNLMSCSALSQEPYTVSTLAHMSANGRLSSAKSWMRCPMDLTNLLVTAAAVLSPTIAHDWIGGSRGSSTTRGRAQLSQTVGTVFLASNPGLPAFVRWSSFVGRESLNEFAVHFCSDSGKAARDGAAGGCVLPPLWPQVFLLHSGTPGDRCAAFRELIRHERGLQGLPRVSVEVCTNPPLSLEYDTELMVNDEDATAKQSPSATEGGSNRIQVLDSEFYADIASAARVHTPWATPLFKEALAHPTAAVAVPQRTRRDPIDTRTACLPTDVHPQRAARRTLDESQCISVEVLSISDSMSAMGITSATWMGTTGKLVVKREAPSTPVVFHGANTLSGYRRMLRYCAKRPVYKTVYLPRRTTTQEALQTLLVAMASNNSNPAHDFDHSRQGEGDRPGTHREKAAMLSTERTGVSHRRRGGHPTLMLIFPFGAGAAAVSTTAHAVDQEIQKSLISLIQEHCRDPAQLASLMSAEAPPQEATFFHAWPLTAPWLAPCGGPLHASLAPVVNETSAAPLPGQSGRRAEDFAGHGAVEYDLRLSVTASPAKPSLSVSNKSEPSLAPFATAVVTRLPASAAWLSTAYAAIRRVLMLSQPQAFSRADSSAVSKTVLGERSRSRHTADLSWILVRCATFTQVAEALLFTITLSPERPFISRDFLKGLVGHSVYTKQRGTATELWLVAAPHIRPACLCTVDGGEGRLGGSAEKKWSTLLQHVMDESCPDVRATVQAVRHLGGCLSALATKNDQSCPPQQCLLSCEWVSRPSVVSEDKPSQWDQIFVAELVSGSPAPLKSGSSLKWSREPVTRRQKKAAVHSNNAEGAARLPAGVMHREEGPDSFGVLWRMLHCPALQPSVTARLSTTATKQECSCTPIPSPDGFLTVAQRALARQRGVTCVTHRYDRNLGGVVVEGWAPQQTSGSKELCDIPMTLVAEPMPLHCVPQRLMQLYHRLLTESHNLPCIPEGVWKQIEVECESTSIETIVQSLCKTLSCAPSDLHNVEMRFVKVWTACLELPLRIFGFSAASQPPFSPPPSGGIPRCDAPPCFYIYSYGYSKKKAIRNVYHLLYQWTRYPQMEAPNNGVQYFIANHKRAVWPDWAAWSASCPSPPLTLPETRDTACTESHALRDSSTSTSGARVVPAPPSTLFSVLDAAHARMETSLGALVGCQDGRVTLRLSQTFGLQLLYGVNAGGVQEKICPSDSVQLLREAWQPLVWAPAQVLSAEVAVLQRLLSSSSPTSGASDMDGASDVGGALREIVHTSDSAQRAPLQIGCDVRAKEFCVSFFRRYFGWRLCDRNDVQNIAAGDGQCSVVILQVAERPSSSRGGQRCRSKGSTLSQGRGAAPRGELEYVTATLQLTQIAPGTESSVRLGRVLVEVNGASPQAALDALWVPCTGHIKSVFGVSCGMSPREADDRMLLFMQSQLK